MKNNRKNRKKWQMYYKRLTGFKPECNRELFAAIQRVPERTEVSMHEPREYYLDKGPYMRMHTQDFYIDPATLAIT